MKPFATISLLALGAAANLQQRDLATVQDTLNGLSSEFVDMDKVINGIAEQFRTIRVHAKAASDVISAQPVLSPADSFTLFAAYTNFKNQVTNTTDHFLTIKDSIESGPDCQGIRLSGYTAWLYTNVVRDVLVKHVDPSFNTIFAQQGNNTSDSLERVWTSLNCKTA